jgi:hypothetical protein
MPHESDKDCIHTGSRDREVSTAAKRSDALRFEPAINMMLSMPL